MIPPEPPTTSFNCVPERPNRAFFAGCFAVSVLVDELVVFMTFPPGTGQLCTGRHVVCSRYTCTLKYLQVDCKRYFVYLSNFLPTLDFAVGSSTYVTQHNGHTTLTLVGKQTRCALAS